MCSHGYDRHVTKWVTFWKVLLLLRRVKTCISITTVSRVKSQKGIQRCVVTGLTPYYWDSYGLVSSMSVSKHKRTETYELTTNTWVLAAGETRFQLKATVDIFKSQDLPSSFTVLKYIFFNFFSKKYFPSKETLKIELQTFITPFIMSSYFHSCLNADVCYFQLFHASTIIFNLKIILPRSM